MSNKLNDLGCGGGTDRGIGGMIGCVDKLPITGIGNSLTYILRGTK